MFQVNETHRGFELTEVPPEPLDRAIEKWEVIIAFHEKHPHDRLYKKDTTYSLCWHYDACHGCPIAEYTSQPLCHGTPYYEYHDDPLGGARAMLAFLQEVKR